MRVLVCGSRVWNNSIKMAAVLQALHDGHPTDKIHLIHGDAQGADRMAGRMGTKLGWGMSIYPANWEKYGKRAGYIRNQQMLDEGKPDLVLAFWDKKSPGTKMMIEIAQKAGVPVTIVT